MNPLALRTYPDPCLRIKTNPVDQFNTDISDTVKAMADIMYASGGIGLAATQVGLGLSMLVVDLGDELIEFINPEIVELSKNKTRMEEGCLSLPGVTVNVARPEKVKVRAQNKNGEFFIKKYDGLMAKALQHEMDHLDGKLLLDHLDPIRRFMVSKSLTGKHKKEAQKTCEVICNVRKRTS